MFGSDGAEGFDEFDAGVVDEDVNLWLASVFLEPMGYGGYYEGWIFWFAEIAGDGEDSGVVR